MKRLYYLTGNLDSTEQISKDIHDAGVTDWRFHVISRDEAGLYRRHVHGATLFQKQDIVRCAERGALVSLGLAIVATVYAFTNKIFGPDATGFVYFSMFGLIALFGVWLGGMVGLSRDNQAIAQFHDQIDAGANLILIDVKPDREQAIRDLMAQKHPEANLAQVGSTWTMPFQSPKSSPA